MVKGNVVLQGSADIVAQATTACKLRDEALKRATYAEAVRDRALREKNRVNTDAAQDRDELATVKRELEAAT